MRNHLHQLQSTNHLTSTTTSPDQVITRVPACMVTDSPSLTIIPGHLIRLTPPAPVIDRSRCSIRATVSQDLPCLVPSSCSQCLGYSREQRRLRLTSPCQAASGPHYSRGWSRGPQLSFTPCRGATGTMATTVRFTTVTTTVTANLSMFPRLQE